MRKSTLTLVSLWCAACALCTAGFPAAAQDSVASGAVAPAVAPTVSPAAPVVAADYRLAEEDVLRVDVWGEPQLTNPQLQVTPGGKVNVAFIGEVQAVGLTQAEFADSIRKKLEEAGIIANAKIQVTVVYVHKLTCHVSGAVSRPGEIQFKEGDRIMDAIAKAGSYREDSWLENATITHKGESASVPLDLRKMFNLNDLSQNYDLRKGDVIYIPERTYANQIYVLGHVVRPGIYPLKENTTALAAITLAGGPNDRGEVKGTQVVRGDPANPQKVKCDLAKVLEKGDLRQDVVLQPGDVVVVPETRKPDWSKISQILSTIINIGYVRRYGLF